MNKGGKASKGASKGSATSYRSSTFQPSKKGDKPHHVSVVQHHEHGSLQISEEPQSTYGVSFTTYMVSVPFTIHEIKSSTTTGESFAGFMVLDSACQRTCCGEIWFEHHQKFLKDFNMSCHIIPTKDMYQFGKGDPTIASRRVYMPTVFGHHPCLLGAGLLPEDIPLLGSNSLMDKLGTIIDLPSRTVRFSSLDCTVELHVKCGHFCIPLFEVPHHQDVHEWHVWKQFTSPELWHDPDPELLLPPEPMTDRVTQVTSNSKPPGHAEHTGTMAHPLATDGWPPHEVQERCVDRDGCSGAIGHHAQDLVERGKDKCDHKDIKRYGNMHGRYGKCRKCLRTWKWNAGREEWEVWVGSVGYSARSSPLPLPPSNKEKDKTAPKATAIKSKAKPKIKRKTVSKPGTSSSAASTSTETRYWTDFRAEYELKMDHLTPEQDYEVYQICEQGSPLDREPHSWAHHAFLFEEGFKEDREKLERDANIIRVRRMVALGVIPEEVLWQIEDWEEESLDWGLVDDLELTTDPAPLTPP